MKAIELVAEYLAVCETALNIANHKLGIASKISSNNVKHRIELGYLQRIKDTSAGKVEAAKEILAALKELEQ